VDSYREESLSAPIGDAWENAAKVFFFLFAFEEAAALGAPTNPLARFGV
jgi:hypothetical protein